IIADVSQVLVMTVNPGFGNQPFIYGTLHKIRRIREMIDQINPECDLEVDGGIDVNTAPLATEAGANVLVAGSAIFQEFDGITNAMNRLKSAVNHAGNATQQKRKDFGKKHFFKHGVDL
ncbi:MAG: hypothetical protein NTV34_02790, partial [Proteobacteria bacterium]|nr:hypothetical protein [Pseudomonadota bacterium]